MHLNNEENENNRIELVVFLVGDLLCGVKSSIIKEISKRLEITPVPGSHSSLRGILNLRGQILTVIDLNQRFCLGDDQLRPEMRVIVISTTDEDVALLVNGVSDVLIAAPENLEPPPSNVGKIEGRFIDSILKQGKKLIAILNIEEVLSLSDENSES
jgi:purine-binding chemotaxis protein CheW